MVEFRSSLIMLPTSKLDLYNILSYCTFYNLLVLSLCGKRVFVCPPPAPVLKWQVQIKSVSYRPRFLRLPLPVLKPLFALLYN